MVIIIDRIESVNLGEVCYLQELGRQTGASQYGNLTNRLESLGNQEFGSTLGQYPASVIFNPYISQTYGTAYLDSPAPGQDRAFSDGCQVVYVYIYSYQTCFFR